DLIGALALNRNGAAIVRVGCLQADLFSRQGVGQGQGDGGWPPGVIDEENETGAGGGDGVAGDQGDGIYGVSVGERRSRRARRSRRTDGSLRASHTHRSGGAGGSRRAGGSGWPGGA